MTVSDLNVYEAQLSSAVDGEDAVRTLKNLPHPANDGALTTAGAVAFGAIALRVLPKLTFNGLESLQVAIAWGTKAVITDVSGEDVSVRMEYPDARKHLANWISLLEWERREAAVSNVYSILLESLRQPQCAKEAYWLIAEIGMRDASILEVLLLKVTTRDDEQGDLALTTALDLLGPAGRSKFSEQACVRFVSRDNSRTLYALQSIADRRCLLAIEERYSPSLAQWPDTTDSFIIAGTLGRIAKRDNSAFVRRRVVDTLRQLYARNPDSFGPPLLFGGNVLPYCDTAQAVRLLIDLIPDSGSKDENHSYLALLRLKDCLSPKQRLGFRYPSARDRLRASIHLGICRPNDYVGRSATREADLKEELLRFACAIGEHSILSLVEEMISAERNPYTLRNLLDELAVFRVSPLPPSISRFVTDFFDEQEVNVKGETLVRLSAIRLAWSCADLTAFSVLLRPGLRLKGEVLWDSAVALADVAVHLCNDPTRLIFVRQMLMASLNGEEAESHVGCVCHALWALSRAGRLLPEHYSNFAEILSGGSLDEYSAGLLASAFEDASDLPVTALNLLLKWAATDKSWRGRRSLEVLAMRGELRGQTEILQSGLHLSEQDGRFRWTPPLGHEEWVGSVIARLYQKDAHSFEGALSDLIEVGPFPTVASAVGSLTHAPPAATNARVKEAIISRIYAQHTRYTAEAYLFTALARVAPEGFCSENWAETTKLWLPEAREALADAYCNVEERVVRSSQNALAILVLLQGDSHYGVRRAAYRATSKSHRALLESIVATRIRSRNPAIRAEATEAMLWLVDTDVAWKEWQLTLSEDASKEVRSAAAWLEEEKRRAKWATWHLGRLLGIRDYSNESLLYLWKHADALTRLGDDTAVKSLRDHLARNVLPPNVRHLLTRTLNGVERSWSEMRRKWPEPMLSTAGYLECGDGGFEVNGLDLQGRYTVWREAGQQAGTQDWGGIIELSSNATPTLPLFDSNTKLRLNNGRCGSVSISGIRNGVEVRFTGYGPFPV